MKPLSSGITKICLSSSRVTSLLFTLITIGVGNTASGSEQYAPMSLIRSGDFSRCTALGSSFLDVDFTTFNKKGAGMLHK